MASIYLDTSALIKLYIEEEGTERVLGLVADPDGVQAVILDLALIESRSAVKREGDISGEDADRILHRIEVDASSSFLVQPSTAAVMEEAARLIDRHPLRAYDAIQLAGCLMVRSRMPETLTFVSSDRRLCEVADREGLTTLNPVSR